MKALPNMGEFFVLATLGRKSGITAAEVLADVEALQDRKLNSGGFYTLIERLDKKGLIRSKYQKEGGGPERRRLWLTPVGRRMLKDTSAMLRPLVVTTS